MIEMPPGNPQPSSRIAIVGVGQVGSTAANDLILGSVATELLLVDVKVELRDAQVRDLSDVTYSRNSATSVRGGTHHEAGQCDIVVITAGSKCCSGQPSIDHIYRNIATLQRAIQAMKPFRSDTILLIVANLVDLLTSLAHEASGLLASQVLGSVTFLDSVRLRGLLAAKAGVATNSIDLYVLGVHGDSQVVAWSTATIAGVPIDKALSPSTLNQAELEDDCKHRSQSIIQVKGAMPFGIGSTVSSICSSILLDKRYVRPISHFQEKFGCCFSLPVVLGRKGIIRKIQTPLSSEEDADIAKSATTLKGMIERVNEDQ